MTSKCGRLHTIQADFNYWISLWDKMTAAQTSDDTKPNASLQTEIDTCYQQLEANISATQTLRADIEEVRRQLQTAMAQNAELLMPREFIEKEMVGYEDLVDVDDDIIFDLAQKSHVSPAAMSIRLQSLSYLSREF